MGENKAGSWHLIHTEIECNFFNVEAFHWKVNPIFSQKNTLHEICAKLLHNYTLPCCPGEEIATLNEKAGKSDLKIVGGYFLLDLPF